MPQGFSAASLALAGYRRVAKMCTACLQNKRLVGPLYPEIGLSCFPPVTLKQFDTFLPVLGTM